MLKDEDILEIYISGQDRSQTALDYAFVAACNMYDMTHVRKLLAEGADIDTSSGQALRFAARDGHFDLVQFLVERGADITICGEGPIRCASGRGHADITAYFISKGADVDAYGEEPLCGAAKVGALDVLQVLVRNGASLRRKSGYRGYYAEKYALDAGHIRCWKYLKRLHDVETMRAVILKAQKDLPDNLLNWSKDDLMTKKISIAPDSEEIPAYIVALVICDINLVLKKIYDPDFDKKHSLVDDMSFIDLCMMLSSEEDRRSIQFFIRTAEHFYKIQKRNATRSRPKLKRRR